MNRLVLLRHGESEWNRKNIFSGWTDVDLSEKGIAEAHEAGHLLKKSDYTFDCAFTSILKRAIRTLWIVLDEMDCMWIPVMNDWRLNERHYGALQGLNKAETARLHGEERVHVWRRSFSVRPPELESNSYNDQKNDPRYQGLKEGELPSGESLEDTIKRVLPCWNDSIVPQIKKGKKVLITAHGNSIRALVMHLDALSKEEIAELNIPTGIPLVYEFDDNLAVLNRTYLGDPAVVEKAAKAVADQGKAG
ncbi:MAG: 2,3-diphosphoglycerate-dependent phosphoglycerate mutase [Chitinispirillaceae bacterium]|nr:2,3-diphosphoglycerate-dependent phosphoglycerate mutase [Chitinispirillaceae bacterium]